MGSNGCTPCDKASQWSAAYVIARTRASLYCCADPRGSGSGQMDRNGSAAPMMTRAIANFPARAHSNGYTLIWSARRRPKTVIRANEIRCAPIVRPVYYRVELLCSCALLHAQCAAARQLSAASASRPDGRERSSAVPWQRTGPYRAVQGRTGRLSTTGRLLRPVAGRTRS